MSVAIEGFLIDAMGKPLHGCELELKARYTSATVLAQTIARQQVSTNGFYSLTVEVGCYDVFLHSPGYRPVLVGRINVYGDSTSGTLNDFLMAMGADDLTPDVVRRFEQLVAQAESAAQSAAESKNEAAKFTQAAEEHATQATQAQQAVASSAEQVRHDAETAVACAEQTAGDAQKALAAQTVVSKLAEEVSENASLVSSSTAQVEENTQVVRWLASDVAQKHAEVVEKTDAAVNAAGEVEQCATEAGEHMASALDAAQRAERAASDAEHLVAGTMQAENCLSEIAALGEEAKHNARQNLGMGNAAVMDVQQDIYDRTAGRAALPGAFGYGARLMNVSRFSSESGPSEFLDWVRRAKPGRYQVSQYGSSRYTPIIDGVVFRGIVEVIFTDAIYEEYNPHLNDKVVIFYGVNGEIFFNRYTSSSGGALLGWENWKLKIDDFTSALWSYTKSHPSSVTLTPDVGGLIVAVYTGKNDGDSAIALSRPAYIPGSRLKMADMKLTSSGSIEVVFENFTISGSYRALSGFSNQGGAPSEKLCLGVFVRVR